MISNEKDQGNDMSYIDGCIERSKECGMYDGSGQTVPSESSGSVSDAMLERAMKVAVREGVFPKMVDMQTGVKNWLVLRACLEAALTE